MLEFIDQPLRSSDVEDLLDALSKKRKQGLSEGFGARFVAQVYACEPSRSRTFASIQEALHSMASLHDPVLTVVTGVGFHTNHARVTNAEKSDLKIVMQFLARRFPSSFSQ